MGKLLQFKELIGYLNTGIQLMVTEAQKRSEYSNKAEVTLTSYDLQVLNNFLITFFKALVPTATNEDVVVFEIQTGTTKTAVEVELLAVAINFFVNQRSLDDTIILDQEKTPTQPKEVVLAAMAINKLLLAQISVNSDITVSLKKKDTKSTNG